MFRVSKNSMAVISLLFYLLPLFVLAQPIGELGSPFAGPPAPGSVGGILGAVLGILRYVVVIVLVLGLVYFLYGVAQYILAAGDEDKKVYGRNVMIYGLIALFVMSAVWGLVTVLQNTFISGVSTQAPTLNLFPTFSN